jgi:hypothetical protein
MQHMASSTAAAPHGLAVGDEVDYNPADGFWVPSRVQALENGGRSLLLRFACGASDVVHRVDISKPSDAKRIAPACEYHGNALKNGSMAWASGAARCIMHCNVMTSLDCGVRVTVIHLPCPASSQCVPHPPRRPPTTHHAGMRSVPLVDKQPVDVLRRTGATPHLGPSEQWQRGE